ncbi:DUF488 family protein [Hahella sp. KA22]|uniref:DUF488 domain-containing protein n=1 Tax=Hahella sp. KA22 TaxID=1628392 RepID=UPI000FDDBDA6|nr:DUF488 domain-containing protein [Hahella sp. KA22]AZZ90250.1 DUF488 domain-containing protein [Hahella sp. KA22]QAY53620.1 DUF488 family protein [Hahella sp. KA22]
MSDSTSSLYSIGYATKPVAVFISQLQSHRIDVVADVRSVPYSRAFHDYHRETLIQHLKEHGLRYVYLGEELGPRSKDPAHYDESRQVQFDRLIQSDLFQSGVARLKEGMNKGFRIALMCAEKDPASCHRSLLIAYALQREGITVRHISHGGDIEAQPELERRLMELTGIQPDMLTPEEECRDLAYRKYCQVMAYRKPE